MCPSAKEKTQRYREDETYVDHVRYLKGSGDIEQDEVTLPVGQLQVWQKGNYLSLIQCWAKEWSLGCVNSRPAARGS